MINQHYQKFCWTLICSIAWPSRDSETRTTRKSSCFMAKNNNSLSASAGMCTEFGSENTWARGSLTTLITSEAISTVSIYSNKLSIWRAVMRNRPRPNIAASLGPPRREPRLMSWKRWSAKSSTNARSPPAISSPTSWIDGDTRSRGGGAASQGDVNRLRLPCPMARRQSS